MATKIAILGLHQSGVSMAMALAPYKKITCTGFDEQREQIEKARKLQVFAGLEQIPARAIKDADIVVLALPADQIEAMLHEISAGLKESAMVVNLSLWHQKLDEIARSALPESVHFISMTPILNPQYLVEPIEAREEPHADLFKQGAFVICTSYETQETTLRLSADLAQLLGAHAYFTEALEADAFLADVEVLPRLLAAALVNAVSAAPAWQENRRLAGKSFFTSSSVLLHHEEKQEAGKVILQSRQEVLRSLDRAMEALGELRTAIEKEDHEKLNALISKAVSDRSEWLGYRTDLDWDTADGLPEKKVTDYHRPMVWPGKK